MISVRRPWKLLKPDRDPAPSNSALREFEWPWYMPTVGRYNTLLSDVLFAEPDIYSQNANRYFKTLDEMMAWIDQSSLVPFLINIDEKDWKHFRNLVVDQMIEKTRQTDGTFFETFRRLNVLARR